MTLRISGTEPNSIFALLGKDENSATFALGWVLEKCPAFRYMVISDLIGHPTGEENDIEVYLQRSDEQGGFTDIELFSKGLCHLIVEAKREWTTPNHEQLEKYSRRKMACSKSERMIVSLSAATREYAIRRLPSKINGVPVTHRSWADIKSVVDAAHSAVDSFKEKLWLRHLSRHLEDYVSMQNPRDNQVYVVSLATAPIKDGDDDYTWIDVVEKDKRYFHPVGNRWPKVPPNYIGFRYYGELQSVHHIDAYKIVGDLSDVNTRWPETCDDHFVYILGPAMKPARQIKTGNIYRNHRVRCSIDTLLSGMCETISDARDETSRRLAYEQADAQD